MSGVDSDGISFGEEHIFDQREYNLDEEKSLTDDEVADAFWRGVRRICQDCDASIVCILAMDEGDLESDMFSFLIAGIIDDVLERALKAVGVFYGLSCRQILNLWTICFKCADWREAMRKIGDIIKAV